VGEMFSVFLSAIFVNNLLLRQFLGVCPGTMLCGGVRKAIASGGVIFCIMMCNSTASWLFDRYVLLPLNAEHLQILFSVLILLTTTWSVEVLAAKLLPSVYAGEHFRLSYGTHCAVLGVALLNLRKGYGFAEMLVHSSGAAIGFSLALLLLAGIMERLRFAPGSERLKGMPQALVAAAVLSAVFHFVVL